MSAAISKWLGEFGEGHVKAILEGRGYQALALQNASGNGIDIIGVKTAHGRETALVVEVKATGGKRYPSVRGAQGDLGKWARSRLVSAASGTGRYRALSSADRSLAARLLKAIDAGTPVAAVLVAVRNIGRGVPDASITGVTRVPKVGAVARPLTRRRPRARFR